MTFEEYLNETWARHQDQAIEVLKDFRSHFLEINSSDEVNSMGFLIAHVSGEHLGEWGKGLRLLHELRENPHCNDKASINRFIAVLSLCEDESFSLYFFSVSDKVMILAMAASALARQNTIERAAKYFMQAEEISNQKLDKKDPAYKYLAVAGNNLACVLEEKENLSHEEMNLMIHAAFSARKFWEIAGTWLEKERAEYRLAKIFLKAEILDKAFTHAEKCLEIISENGCEPLEQFFGLEVMALIEKARGNDLGKKEAHQEMCATFNKINPKDQLWCKETLEKVTWA